MSHDQILLAIKWFATILSLGGTVWIAGKLAHERDYSSDLRNDMLVEQRLRLKADALNATMKPLLPLLRECQPIISNLAMTYGEGHVLKYGQTESVGLIKRIDDAFALWAEAK